MKNSINEFIAFISMNARLVCEFGYQITLACDNYITLLDIFATIRP